MHAATARIQIRRARMGKSRARIASRERLLYILRIDSAGKEKDLSVREQVVEACFFAIPACGVLIGKRVRICVCIGWLFAVCSYVTVLGDVYPFCRWALMLRALLLYTSSSILLFFIYI